MHALGLQAFAVVWARKQTRYAAVLRAIRRKLAAEPLRSQLRAEVARAPRLSRLPDALR